MRIEIRTPLRRHHVAAARLSGSKRNQVRAGCSAGTLSAESSDDGAAASAMVRTFGVFRAFGRDMPNRSAAMVRTTTPMIPIRRTMMATTRTPDQVRSPRAQPIQSEG
ncbi:MAG: hypothetical protein JF571_11340 [Asticcacaulis sp.]|nr:hypothetical protein [Asticcacaulis sp.]